MPLPPIRNPLFHGEVEHSEPKKTKYSTHTIEERKDTAPITTSGRVGEFIGLTGKTLLTGAAWATLNPGLGKRAWRNAKESWQPVRSGKKTYTVRVIDTKVEISDGPTRDRIGVLRTDYDAKMATYKAIGEAKTLDEAIIHANLYIISANLDLISDAPTDREAAADAKGAKLDATSAKIDTTLTETHRKFSWKREDAAMPTIREGLREVQEMARQDADQALQKLNHQARVAEAIELKGQWTKGSANALSDIEKMAIAADKKHKFDPGVRASICYYVENAPGVKLRESENDQYLIVSEKSGFIYIPDGDMEKITFIHFADAETGKDIKDSSKLNRLAHCHMEAQSSIKEGLDELYEKLVKKHPKLKRPALDSSTFTYDFVTKQVFVHVGSQHLNTRHSKQPKLEVKIDTKVWERMYDIIDPKKVVDEGKGKLDGSKVSTKAGRKCAADRFDISRLPYEQQAEVRRMDDRLEELKRDRAATLIKSTGADQKDRLYPINREIAHIELDKDGIWDEHMDADKE